MWRDGAAWNMHKAGITGKVWRVMRAMEKGLKGRIWIGGIKGDIREYEGGINQGACPSPFKWNWGTALEK